MADQAGVTAPGAGATALAEGTRAPGPVLAPGAVPGTGGLTLIRPARARHRRVAIMRMPRLARRAIGPIAAIALWQLVCSRGLFTSFEMASPVAVFDAARELAAQGVLQSNLLISLQRVAEGLLLGVGTGVFLAVLCGLFW